MTPLHSTVRGEGEPIVLIHGLGHRHQVWDVLTPHLLADGLRVIAIDLPGHGHSTSSWHPASYSIDATVGRIVETMRELGVERPHVVGNSLGGLIALELAAHGHARSVTALAPAGFSPPLHLLRAGGALLGNRVAFARTTATIPDDPGLPDESSPDDAVRAGEVSMPVTRHDRITHATSSDAARAGSAAHRARAVLRRFRALHSWAGFAGYLPHAFLARFRGELTVPATIAWGADDAILDADGLRRAASRIPEIAWVEIPDCGHFPMTQAPEPTARLVLETVHRARAES